MHARQFFTVYDDRNLLTSADSENIRQISEDKNRVIANCAVLLLTNSRSIKTSACRSKLQAAISIRPCQCMKPYKLFTLINFALKAPLIEKSFHALSLRHSPARIYPSGMDKPMNEIIERSDPLFSLSPPKGKTGK